jgi:hypothetical protein
MSGSYSRNVHLAVAYRGTVIYISNGVESSRRAMRYRVTSIGTSAVHPPTSQGTLEILLVMKAYSAAMNFIYYRTDVK